MFKVTDKFQFDNLHDVAFLRNVLSNDACYVCDIKHYFQNFKKHKKHNCCPCKQNIVFTNFLFYAIIKKAIK